MSCQYCGKQTKKKGSSSCSGYCYRMLKSMYALIGDMRANREFIKKHVNGGIALGNDEVNCYL